MGAAYSRDMIKWMLPSALLIALACGGPAGAEEPATQLDTSTQDGVTTSTIFFEYASCGGECQIARLSCNADANITIVLADIEAKYAAAAMMLEEKQVILKADGKSFDYYIFDMQYTEMTGAWWLTVYSRSGRDEEIAVAITKSKSVEAVVGEQTVTLPVDKNFLTWAQGCK